MQMHREVVTTNHLRLVWQNPVMGVCTMLEFRNCSYLHIVGHICAAAFQILAAEGSD